MEEVKNVAILHERVQSEMCKFPTTEQPYQLSKSIGVPVVMREVEPSSYRFSLHFDKRKQAKIYRVVPNLDYIAAFRFLSQTNNIVFLRSENSAFLKELVFTQNVSATLCQLDKFLQER